MSKAIANYSVLSGKKAISVDRAIELAGQSVTKMRKSIQVACVAVCMHAVKHGDYSKAQVLVDTVGNAVNKASLQKWFVDYAGLIVDSETGLFSGWQGAEYIREHFDDAKKKAWWECKEAPAYKGMSIIEEINKLVKRGEAVLEKLNKIAAEFGTDSVEYQDAMAKTDVDMNTLRTLRAVAGKVELVPVEKTVNKQQAA